MDPPQNSRAQIGEMREVPYWGPTNIRYHDTRFILHGELAPRICALLLQPNSCTHFDFRVNKRVTRAAGGTAVNW